MFHRLLDDRVAVAEGRLDEITCSPADLYEGEYLAIQNAVARRRHEFISGRVLARRAMAKLGVPAQSIPAGPDRAPIWPEGLVGSITHGGSWCAAAVARAGEIRSIGIDIEESNAFEPDLWPTACTARELHWLSGLSADARMMGATILFSAKEAVYKAQYPLTLRMLEHKDVEVVVSADGCGWVATLTHPTAESHPPVGSADMPETWKGQSIVEDGLIATCVVIPIQNDS